MEAYCFNCCLRDARYRCAAVALRATAEKKSERAAAAGAPPLSSSEEAVEQSALPPIEKAQTGPAEQVGRVRQDSDCADAANTSASLFSSDEAPTQPKEASTREQSPEEQRATPRPRAGERRENASSMSDDDAESQEPGSRESYGGSFSPDAEDSDAACGSGSPISKVAAKLLEAAPAADDKAQRSTRSHSTEELWEVRRPLKGDRIVFCTASGAPVRGLVFDSQKLDDMDVLVALDSVDEEVPIAWVRADVHLSSLTC